ncbi:cytochrome C oxidase subunit II [Bacillus horti]|uniref:Plastocyanin n=1 Tax=Caldalkalibacillus horti TaxID=77523 RepID=A0ABT9VTI8_9BACI|nr:cytochrome C oxidase subunit II [Bacillus horti]MDQ0164306.1 plastocyanin [Bacillus horti]
MKKFWMLGMLLVLSLALAACGGADDNNTDNNGTETPVEEPGDTNGDATGDASNEVTIEASNFDFDQEEYVVSAGEVTVNLVNTEGVHGIQILGTDIDISRDGSQTATLEPGEYDIICSIMCGTGHADMTAKLIVQ